jgi:hypothetical protein
MRRQRLGLDMHDAYSVSLPLDLFLWTTCHLSLHFGTWFPNEIEPIVKALIYSMMSLGESIPLKISPFGWQTRRYRQTRWYHKSNRSLSIVQRAKFVICSSFIQCQGWRNQEVVETAGWPCSGDHHLLSTPSTSHQHQKYETLCTVAASTRARIVMQTIQMPSMHEDAYTSEKKTVLKFSKASRPCTLGQQIVFRRKYKGLKSILQLTANSVNLTLKAPVSFSSSTSRCPGSRARCVISVSSRSPSLFFPQALSPLVFPLRKLLYPPVVKPKGCFVTLIWGRESEPSMLGFVSSTLERHDQVIRVVYLGSMPWLG